MTEKIKPLNAKEAKAAALRAQGYTQTDAWRIAFNRPQVKPSTAWVEASKVFRKPQVFLRVRELLAKANILDIDCVGQAYRDLLDATDRATAAENWTAVAQLSRLRLQALGMLKDHVALTVEQRSDDEALIKQIAGDDAVLAESLRRRLGREGFDA